MTATTRVAAAVAAGYLLGRTKKLRLAITVGTMLAGGRMANGVRPGVLVQSLSENPEVQRLQEQLRGQVLTAAKSAAANVASSRLEALNQSLLAGRGDEDSDDQPDDQADEGQADEGQADDVQDEAQDTDEDEGQDDEGQAERSSRDDASSRAKKRPARSKSSSPAKPAGGRSNRSADSGSSGTAKRAAAKTATAKPSSGAAKRPARKKSASSSTGR